MIQVLDSFISDKIAAGEVIERPLSIVKELVENSIDAGADSIVVEIRNGGKSYIRVTDNGCGIPAEEAEIAFERHATGKIQTLEDLEGKVMAVQSTTKPEDIIRSHDGTLPELRKVISVQKRDLIFILLSKGYVDALAAHDTSVDQFMKESGLKFRILEEPLQTVDLGVAFDKADTRGLNIQLTDTLKEMQKDGTVKQIISKYLLNADSYLEEE